MFMLFNEHSVFVGGRLVNCSSFRYYCFFCGCNEWVTEVQGNNLCFNFTFTFTSCLSKLGPVILTFNMKTVYTPSLVLNKLQRSFSMQIFIFIILYSYWFNADFRCVPIIFSSVIFTSVSFAGQSSHLFNIDQMNTVGPLHGIQKHGSYYFSLFHHYG